MSKTEPTAQIQLFDLVKIQDTIADNPVIVAIELPKGAKLPAKWASGLDFEYAKIAYEYDFESGDFNFEIMYSKIADCSTIIDKIQADVRRIANTALKALGCKITK